MGQFTDELKNRITSINKHINTNERSVDFVKTRREKQLIDLLDNWIIM